MRVFGGEERLEALIDSLNAAVFGHDKLALQDTPSRGDGRGLTQ